MVPWLFLPCSANSPPPLVSICISASEFIQQLETVLFSHKAGWEFWKHKNPGRISQQNMDRSWCINTPAPLPLESNIIYKLLRWHSGKESTCDAGDTRDMSSITGLGRFPEVGSGNPLQYSCLENSMDRRAWGVIVHGIAKSWTWLSNWACTTIVRKSLKHFKENVQPFWFLKVWIELVKCHPKVQIQSSLSVDYSQMLGCLLIQQGFIWELWFLV